VKGTGLNLSLKDSQKNIFEVWDFGRRSIDIGRIFIHFYAFKTGRISLERFEPRNPLNMLMATL